MILQRPFGDTGIHTSTLVFGAMRLNPARLSAPEATQLISYLAECGVTTWHSSHEYDTHPFFCEIFRSLKLPNPVHVMKLGEPHFDMPRFRPERFINLIEQELRALGTEQIGIVQWLLRSTPNEDTIRLPLLMDCIEEVEATVQKLKAQGKIGAFAVFPYTPAVADICLSRPSCDGLVTYLNPAEQECMPFLPAMQHRGQGFLAIRPLFAGKLLDANTPEGKAFAALCEREAIAFEDRTAFALRWPLMQPTVSGTILSVSSMPHARQAVEALQNI